MMAKAGTKMCSLKDANFKDFLNSSDNHDLFHQEYQVLSYSRNREIFFRYSCGWFVINLETLEIILCYKEKRKNDEILSGFQPKD